MALQGLILALDRTLVDTNMRAQAGVVKLLEACRERGLRLALATPHGPEGLEGKVDALVSSDCPGQSHTAPERFQAAARALELHPAQCALIGDTASVADACRHAGVVCIGVSGGDCDEASLVGAGARLVYRSVVHLLEHFEEALSQASPSRVVLRQGTLEQMMREALVAAEEGMRKGDAPIGCAIFDGDGRCVARGHNEMATSGNKTAHAEIVTFARAAGKLPLESRDSILVSTLEPCVMCTGAAMEAAVDTIVYGLRAPADSGTGRVQPPSSPESQMPRIVGDVLAFESRRLFERWLEANRDKPQAAFVKQLLALTR